MQYGVSGGHELTVQAAEDILKAGGTAVDAAIAAFVMTWVAEPCMSSAGGGGFAMAFHKGEAPVLFDFFCQTPLKRTPPEKLDFFPVEVDFGDTFETFYVGKGSTAVPGSVAGIFAMHQQFGRIPMTDLVQPAIDAAKNGVLINRFQQFDFQLLEPILRLNEHGQLLFFRKERLIEVGEIMRLPQMADFLEVLAREGEGLFYQGEVAKAITADYESGGGGIGMEDFLNYKVEIRKPLQIPYREFSIFTNPPPCLGGVLCATILQLLEKQRPANHLEENYVKYLYDTLQKVIKLPRVPLALQQLIHKELQTRRGSTTHFNVVDKWGNAVSLTSTNGEGNGYFIPNTDIQLNNMLGEAALLPQGFHNWTPNTRLSSMMAPSLVLDGDHQIKIVLGSGGAGRISSAIAQVLHLLIDHELGIEDSIRAPRLHLEAQLFNIEKGFEGLPDDDIFDVPVKRWKQQSLFFGGVHTIMRSGSGWVAAGDQRRDGVAIVGA